MHDWKIKMEDVQAFEGAVLASGRNLVIETDLNTGKMEMKSVSHKGPIRKLLHLFKPDRNRQSTDPLQFQLQKVDPADAETERSILLREYELTQESGRHWDLLRWNVSKFFLGIQTIFLAGATKGLLDLTVLPSGSNLHAFLPIGIQLLSGMNIVLCLIWLFRNRGIHAWHMASTKRVLMIEADPRLRGCLQHVTTVLRGMRMREGFFGVILHGTGELESWGPPVVFMLLWAAVFVLSKWPNLLVQPTG